MKGGEIKIKYVNGGRRAKNELWDNDWFILLARASHFRSVSKTVFIPKDLCHRCYWRTCRSRCGILDASREFRRKILGSTGLLIRYHSIPRPFVLWQHLHVSYPSRAHELVDSNLAAVHEVLGVVDEFLMNPVNFHIDDPSLLINGHFDGVQEGLP
jgi:hypothetical protein